MSQQEQTTTQEHQQQQKQQQQQEEPSTISANTKYYTGAAKETVGQLTGSEKLQEEGATQKQQAQSELESLHGQDSTKTDTDTNTNTNNDQSTLSSSIPSKLSGNVDSASGAAKETVGSGVGCESLQEKGADQKRSGNEKAEDANITEAGKKVTDTVKEKAGNLVGNQ